jgi:hypothetical protein
MRVSRLPSSKADRPGTAAAGRRLAGRLNGRVVGTDTIRFGGWQGFALSTQTSAALIPSLEGKHYESCKEEHAEVPQEHYGTGKKPTGFTDEERVAMRERLQELKADARRGRRTGKADGESHAREYRRATAAGIAP